MDRNYYTGRMGDNDFDDAARRMLSVRRENADDLLIDPGRLDHLQTLSDRWSTSLDGATAAESTYRTAVSDKSAARDRYRRAMSSAVRSVRIDDRVDAELRRRSGIERTGDHGVGSDEALSLRPALTVAATDRLTHTLSLRHPDGPPGRV